MHQNNHIPLLPPNQLLKPITEETRIELQRITRILLDSHRRKSGDFDVISRLAEKGGKKVKMLRYVEGAVYD